MSENANAAPVEPKVLAVPLNEDGSIGALPDQLQKLVDARIREATKRAQAKADPSPVEAEELRQLRAKVAEQERLDAERRGEYDKAVKMREDAYAAEHAKLTAEIARRTERIKASVAADIRAAALEQGARRESLDELGTLLGRFIALDDASLAPVVLGDDGQPSDRSVVDMVKAYLDTHPHHKVAAGSGGGARGGASFAGGHLGGAAADVAAAQDRINKGDRSPDAINALYEAARKARAS